MSNDENLPTTLDEAFTNSCSSQKVDATYLAPPDAIVVCAYSQQKSKGKSTDVDADDSGESINDDDDDNDLSDDDDDHNINDDNIETC